MELVEQYGFRQGIYRGFWPMFWRDVPAWATYFWGYDFFKSLFTRKDEPLTLWLTVRLILCAGVAGQLSWVVSYPFDVVKCVIQCSDGPIKTMREVSRENYAKFGARWFFSGLSATMV